MPNLSLHWPVDRKGYHVEDAQTVTTGRRKTIAHPEGEGARIVRNGGEIDSKDVMQVPGLYRQLASCPRTAEGALSFLSRFGFLFQARAKSESVQQIIDQMNVVNSLIDHADDVTAIETWMAEHGRKIRLGTTFKKNNPPLLFVTPLSLIDAIYLQFLEDLSTGAKLRLCKRPGCGEWFHYGPGTEHRNTAEYCSPKCQKAHAYAKAKGARS